LAIQKPQQPDHNTGQDIAMKDDQQSVQERDPNTPWSLTAMAKSEVRALTTTDQDEVEFILSVTGKRRREKKHRQPFHHSSEQAPFMAEQNVHPRTGNRSTLAVACRDHNTNDAHQNPSQTAFAQTIKPTVSCYSSPISNPPSAKKTCAEAETRRREFVSCNPALSQDEESE
jgi:hypothetical protein